jgi:hypothetical protein
VLLNQERTDVVNSLKPDSAAAPVKHVTRVANGVALTLGFAFCVLYMVDGLVGFAMPVFGSPPTPGLATGVIDGLVVGPFFALSMVVAVRLAGEAVLFCIVSFGRRGSRAVDGRSQS